MNNISVPSFEPLVYGKIFYFRVHKIIFRDTDIVELGFMSENNTTDLVNTKISYNNAINITYIIQTATTLSMID